MSRSKTITKKQFSFLLFFIAILLGGFIRLFEVLLIKFPLNDGGLFFTMTNDLIANGFRIPQLTTYNHLDLPFAYPPLQFYIAGLFSTFTHWSLLDIFRIFPAIFSVLSIPAFYLFAKDILNDELHASLATFIFAFTPAAFNWPIMGGGITRSAAFFFALLTLFSIHRLYNNSGKKYIIFTTIFAVITVLSHPEMALHTAASALVFFLFWGKNKIGLIKSFIVLILTLLLSSPWWITVFSNHQLTPFLAAAKTGWYDFSFLIRFVFTNQLGEFGLTSIGVLSLIGLFFYLAERKFLLPIWGLVVFFAEPRSAPLFLTPVIAIFASYSLMQIMNLLHKNENLSIIGTSTKFSGMMLKILFGIFFAQWIFSSYTTVTTLTNSYLLSSSEIDAFDWIKENTPDKSRFVVITGNAPLTDPVSEWFPALTERSSISTAQGYEWAQNINFTQVLQRSNDLQNCITQSLDCVRNWSIEYDMPYDYIFLDDRSLQQDDNKSQQSALAELLLESDDFVSLYSDDGITVYKKKGS